MERVLIEVINLSVDQEIRQLAARLNCPTAIVIYCSNKVGPSVSAIESYWSMNKEWLLKYKGRAKLN